MSYELAQVALPVLIACGNHDPLIEGGSYLRTEIPDNVTVVPRRSVSDHSFGDVSAYRPFVIRERLRFSAALR